MACGNNQSGQCDIPVLTGGRTYTQVAAGGSHTVLLLSDGSAIACGQNQNCQCDIPALADGKTCTQVAAGGSHSVLLLSDGTAMTCCDNTFGQCDIPALSGSTTYTHVAAGEHHVALLRSDGTAVACGGNLAGQCRVPPKGDHRYVVPPVPPRSLPMLVLQASVDGDSIVFLTLGGHEFCRISAGGEEHLSDMYVELTTGHLAGKLGSAFSKFDVVLPGDAVLGNVTIEEPGMKVQDIFGAGLAKRPDRRSPFARSGCPLRRRFPAGCRPLPSLRVPAGGSFQG